MVKNSQKSVIKEKMLTKHFIKRYNQRISSKRYTKKKDIVEALNTKMSDREKSIFKFFRDSKSVKLPFDKSNQMVVCRGRLITIY